MKSPVQIGLAILLILGCSSRSSNVFGQSDNPDNSVTESSVDDPVKKEINYDRLESLLKEKNWEAADEETRSLIAKLTDTDFFYNAKEIFNNIPCEELRKIDTLWSQASDGHFGYTAQAKIWQQIASKSMPEKNLIEQFARTVGWYRNKPLPQENSIGFEASGTWWRLDSELTYALSAPAGHLPWIGIASSFMNDLLASIGCGSCPIDVIYSNSHFAEVRKSRF